MNSEFLPTTLSLWSRAVFTIYIIYIIYSAKSSYIAYCASQIYNCICLYTPYFKNVVPTFVFCGRRESPGNELRHIMGYLVLVLTFRNINKQQVTWLTSNQYARNNQVHVVIQCLSPYMECKRHIRVRFRTANIHNLSPLGGKRD